MKQIKLLMKEIEHEENTSDIYETKEQDVVENNVERFFNEKHLAKPTSKPKKKRNYIPPIVSGRAITEDEVAGKIQNTKRMIPIGKIQKGNQNQNLKLTKRLSKQNLIQRKEKHL
jgi:hypothetical protein